LKRARVSTQTRIVAAILLVAIAVLGVSYIATFALVRRSLEQNALDTLQDRAHELRDTVNAIVTDESLSGQRLGQRQATIRRDLRVVLRIGDVRAVFVTPKGEINPAGVTDFFQLPPTITANDIQPDALLAGQQVSGRRGDTVFLALPVRTVGQQTMAVVATDDVETTVLRRALPWMLVAGLVVLAGAFAVALWLSRRLTRPVAEIERAATQLAHGDLTARADVAAGTDEELAALATTLNALAAQLEHARGTERAFLLSVSHDLRTPLTSIRGYAEALADGPLVDAGPEERRRAATVIGAEARRLERLVRDLLDLSRLDTRQFSLSPRPCDATEVVRDAAEAFAPQARELGISLSVLPGQPLPADIDPERLAQIVANLVENALKYAAATVKVSVAPDDATNVAVVVTDDGPGIPPEQLGRVFERLYTVRETPGRAVGTGLGLAIVRELAMAMGGNAWAEPGDEGGSRFVVSVPTNVHATMPSER
jgi:two-component system sensor histidine kinase BaeS